MLSANDAAGKTAMAKLSKLNGAEWEMIEQRIAGAASAGLTGVLVEIQGNVIDSDVRETIRQALIDAGYTVALNYRVKTETSAFQISW